jgi:hypothetical protein
MWSMTTEHMNGTQHRKGLVTMYYVHTMTHCTPPYSRGWEESVEVESQHSHVQFSVGGLSLRSGGWVPGTRDATLTETQPRALFLKVHSFDEHHWTPYSRLIEIWGWVPVGVESHSEFSPVGVESQSGLSPDGVQSHSEFSPVGVESQSGLSPVGVESWSGLSPVGVESIRSTVPFGVESHSGLSPVGVQSHSGFSPVGVESHSGLGPVGVQSIRGSVHSGLSLSRFSHSRFSRWI